MLVVEGGEHYGFVVDAGGVAVDGGGGLGAEVAVAGVEVEGADVVSAVGAGELHASLDARHGVKAFHRFEFSLLAERSDRNEGCAAKVMRGESSRMGMREVRSAKSEVRGQNAEVKPCELLLLHSDL